MSKIIGIDLGTTNSVVAVMEGGEPTVITTQEAAALLRPLSVSQKWGTPRWSAGKTSGCFQPGTDHQLHQTSHGHEVYRDH